MKKRVGNDSPEQGVALLFALGMMSLLLVLALAFATNAAIARKAAANTASRSQVRVLADSAVNRLLAQLNLRNLHSGQILPTFVKLVSYSKDGAGQLKNDQLTGGNDSLLAIKDYNSTDYYFSPSDGLETRWQFVSAENGDGVKRLIGRYAYMILPEAPKLDLALTRKTQPGTTPTEIYERRPGQDATEIVVDGVADFDIVRPNLPELSGRRSLSYQQNAVEKSIALSDTAQLSRLREQFEVSNPRDLEAYWVDTNSDDVQQYRNGSAGSYGSELFHRFNLARNDWDSVFGGTDAVNKLLGLVSGVGNEEWQPKPLLDKDGKLTHDGTVTGSGVKQETANTIPYLRMVGDANGNYPDIETRRKQVAANLITYCRPLASGPASDVAPADWSTANAPRYTGNAKTPYINEIAFQVAFSQISLTSQVPATPPEILNTYTFEVQPTMDARVELINFYNTTYAASALSVLLDGITLDLTLTFNVNGATITKTVAIPVTSLDLTFPGGAGPYLVSSDISATTLALPPITFTVKATAEPSPTATVTLDNPFRFSSAILRENGANRDYVRSLEVETAKVAFPNLSTSSGSSVTIDAEVAEARDNLYTEESIGNWVVSTPSNTDGTLGGTLNAANSNVSGVFETSYIRHEPMKSPAELAYIHRGATNEFLNLASVPDPADQAPYRRANGIAITDTANGLSYATGDGMILDQIKMTPAIAAYGKVELNNQINTLSLDASTVTRYQDIARRTYQALFNKLVYGNTFGAVDGMTTALSDATRNNLADTLVGNTVRFYHRSQAIDRLKGAISGLNDHQKSEIIGRVMNLTKTDWKPTVVRAVLYVQSLRDVGGDGAAIPVSKAKADGTAVVGTAQLNRFDYDETHNVYFDEITGEQKMLLTIVRDPVTNQFHVVSQELID